MATSDTSRQASLHLEGAAKPTTLVSFVLPVYDEEGSLETLYKAITTVMDRQERGYEMIFVDDGSRDRSFEIMTQLHEQDRRVRVIQLRRNFGKSAAYNAGFAAARGGFVITMDTDLQDDPEEIPLFLDKLDEGFDMVVGWKYEGKGSFGKRVPSKVVNSVVSRVTGVELHDFNCPFKAYRKEVLDEIDVYGELHRFIPVLASAKGFTFAEVKIKNLPRLTGTSKFGLERYLRGMLDLLTISFITRFAKRPMHLLGASGVLAVAVGGATIGSLVVAHFLHVFGVLADEGWIIHERPALTLGILLLVVGVQFLSIGLLGELLVHRHGIAADDHGYSIKQILEEDE
jgi:glycosyltransferase involved in cell wall biosynthesis